MSLEVKPWCFITYIPAEKKKANFFHIKFSSKDENAIQCVFCILAYILLRNFKIEINLRDSISALPLCVSLYCKHKLVNYNRGFNINSMTAILTSSCAKSVKGLSDLNVQIGDYRRCFSEILRPLTLRTYAISILLYYWNKQALGDQNKITEYFLYNSGSFSRGKCYKSRFRIPFHACSQKYFQFFFKFFIYLFIYFFYHQFKPTTIFNKRFRMNDPLTTFSITNQVQNYKEIYHIYEIS